MAPTPVADAAVAALLGRWLPGGDVCFERMAVGGSTPVYRVTKDDGIAYLRCAEEPGERRDAEVRAHQLAREAGIRVPEVLRYEARPAELDRSAALTAEMPGVPLTQFAGDPTPALEAAGRDLARLNAIPVTGYGWADRVGADGGIVAEHADREPWVGEILAAAAKLRAVEHLDRTMQDRLDAALARWAGRDDADTSHLCHGDADASHIFVDAESGAYQGLIDLGEIRGAERIHDLAQLFVVEPDHLEAVCRGYGHPGDDPAIRLQAIAIITRAIAIQLERPHSGWRQHLTRRLGELLAG